MVKCSQCKEKNRYRTMTLCLRCYYLKNKKRLDDAAKRYYLRNKKKLDEKSLIRKRKWRERRRIKLNLKYNSNNMSPDYHKKYGGNAIKALELDEKCIHCSSKKDLVIHHFNKNKSDNNLKNLITLCRSCHTSFHNLAKDFGHQKNSLAEKVKIFGFVLATIRDAKTNLILRRTFDFNLVPTVGRQQIAKALTGQLTGIDEIEVNESAVGTGATAPANGDTTLDTESFRKAIASQSFSSNVAYNTAFYTAGDFAATVYEHGIFIDGTGGADSGILFSRVLLNAPSGIAKSNSETLTIEHVHTFS